jgi:hypothetical protein
MEAINRDNIMEALKAREHELCAAGVESVSNKRSTGIAPLPSDKIALRVEDIIENARAEVR